MKKRNINYLFLTALCFVIILFSQSQSVFGYNIEYKAKNYDSGAIAIDMVVKSNRNWGNTSIDRYNDWINSPNIPGWGYGSYGSAQMGFSKTPMLTYTTSADDTDKGYSYPEYYSMGMAKSDSVLSTDLAKDKDAIRKLFSDKNAVMVFGVKKNPNADSMKIYDLVKYADKEGGICLTDNYYYNIKQGDLDYTDNTNPTSFNLVFSRFEIPKHIIETTIQEIAKKNNNKVYFSSLLRTNRSSSITNPDTTISTTALEMLQTIQQHRWI